MVVALALRAAKNSARSAVVSADSNVVNPQAEHAAHLTDRQTTPRASELRRRLTVLIAVVLAQGAIGYIQYFNGVPALLVQFHIVGATAFFISVFWVRAAVTNPGTISR